MKITVADVMSRQVVTARPSTDFKSAAGLMRAFDIGSLPVIDPEGQLVGVISEADMLAKLDIARHRGFFARLLDLSDAKASAVVVGDAMTRDPITVSPSAGISQVARLMRTRLLKHLPVVDGGRLVGVVSRTDLLKAFVRDDRSLHEEIERDLIGLGVDPKAIKLAVIDNTVWLEGSVESRTLVSIVERMVRNLPGVVAVHNRLRYAFDDTKVGEAHEPWEALSYSGRSPRSS